MKFDLSDFQSTQIKIPTIEDVCLKNHFDPTNFNTSTKAQSGADAAAHDKSKSSV